MIVKDARILLMVIPAVIVVGAAVGFLIALSYPQVAYGRLFIDLGVLVACISACLSLKKPFPLPIDNLISGLRELGKGSRFRPLKEEEFGELFRVAQAINELSETIKASRSAWEQYSYHPELGQVQLATMIKSSAHLGQSQANVPSVQEGTLSGPPGQKIESNNFSLGSVSSDWNKTSETERVQLLYEQFKEAHLQDKRPYLDFQSFKQTIEKTSSQLRATHQCREVRFEIVKEAGEVALKPYLVR